MGFAAAVRGRSYAFGPGAAGDAVPAEGDPARLDSLFSSIGTALRSLPSRANTRS
jgi:hypothetical protein